MASSTTDDGSAPVAGGEGRAPRPDTTWGYPAAPVELADLLGVDLAALGWVRPSWWDSAACRGQGVALFFPATGSPAAYTRALANARQVCDVCPVWAPCLEVARSVAPSVDHFGVYGGTDHLDRAALRRLGPPREVARAWAAGTITLERHQVA